MESNTKCDPMSRRGFLTALGSAGAALLTLSPGAFAASEAQPGGQTHSLANMQSLVGSKFTIRVENGPVEMRLDRVVENQSHANLQSYIAHFVVVSESNRELPQGAYTLNGSKRGQMDLMLQPGNDGPTRLMTAHFCQLIKA